MAPYEKRFSVISKSMKNVERENEKRSRNSFENELFPFCLEPEKKPGA